MSSTPQPREVEPAKPAEIELAKPTEIEPAEPPLSDIAEPPEIDSIEPPVLDFVEFPATDTVEPPTPPAKHPASPGFQSTVVAPLPFSLQAYLQSSTSTQSMPPSLSSPNPDQDMPFPTPENREELALPTTFEAIKISKYLRSRPSLRRKDFRPSRITASLPQYQVFLPAVREMISQVHAVEITLDNAQVKFKRAFFSAKMEPPADWNEMLHRLKKVRQSTEVGRLWRNFEEAQHWGYICEEAKTRASQRSKRHGQDLILEVFNDYMSNVTADKSQKARTKQLLIRLHKLYEANHSKFVIYRTPAFNNILNGHTVGIKDKDIMEWAEFISPIISKLLDYHGVETIEGMEEVDKLHQTSEGKTPSLWSRLSTRWKSPTHAADFFDANPQYLATPELVYGSVTDAFAMHKYGYLGERTLNFSWAVTLVNYQETDQLITVADVQPGSFLGIIPGCLTFGNPPGSGYIPGPDGLWLEVLPSNMARLLTPQFAKKGNVVAGWEKRQGLLAYGVPSFIFMAFAARPISMFEELSL